MSANSHPRNLHLLALLMLMGASAGAAWGSSVNWESTVGEPIADMEHERFRYELDLRPTDRRSAQKNAKCLLCEPASTWQLDDQERLDQRLRYTYRKLGEDLAARLWDDPKGRRVRFDVSGRPGLGLVIPLD
jgi:hypothetical protein